MPKIKECPHCGEVLHCQKCGKRFTSEHESIGTELAATRLTPSEKEQLQKAADDLGITLAAYLRKLVVHCREKELQEICKQKNK